MNVYTILLSDYNYHIFVLVSSIVYYFLLRKYSSKGSTTKTTLYLTFYVPLVLYISYLFINYNANLETVTTKPLNESVFSDIYKSSINV